MRRVGREGRSITKSFSYPNSMDKMIVSVESIARREGTYFSDIVVELLKNYVKEHGKSQNPQTEITLFETGVESAIPNIYAQEEFWDKFYSLINKRVDFEKLDDQLNMILRKHNNRDKELSR